MTAEELAWFESKFTELETRIERTETRLLTEFHKWASPADARLRGHRDQIHALDLDFDGLQARVAALEKKLP